MYYDAVKVEPRDNFELYVECQDGKRGFFDLKPYLDFGVFSELKNLDYFKQVHILFGALAWTRGQDIAPSKLYAELRGHS
jgi:hypothetical protein